MPKNTKELTQRHKEDLKGLFKKFQAKNPNADELTWIDKNKRNLLKFIKDLKFGNSRTKDLIFAVARYLHVNGDERYSKIYSQEGFDYYKLIMDNEKQGKQTEKEEDKYMSLDAIKQIAKDTSYLHDNLESHYQHLLLNLITLQPPLRADFYVSCLFISQEKQNDKIHNFLFVNKRTKKAYYIVNDDKIKTARIRRDKIELNNKELKNIITQSLILYPRNHLFENSDATAYSYDKLLKLLKTATHNEGIGFNLIRSAYINDFYETKLDVKSREELAMNMRHLLSTSMTHYHKPNLNKKNDDCNCDATDKDLVETKASLEVCNLKTEELENEINPDDKTLKKRRRNLLVKINQSTSQPRLSSIEKYNLVFENGKWN